MSLFARRHDQPEDPQKTIDEWAAQHGEAPVPAAAAGVAGESVASFQMPVDDVFLIKGRGVVVTGTVSSGEVRRGAEIAVYRNMQPIGALKVVGLEMFRKQTDSAVVGQNVGLLLSATDRAAVQRGDMLVGR
jgi:elongation factor Tu